VKSPVRSILSAGTDCRRFADGPIALRPNKTHGGYAVTKAISTAAKDFGLFRKLTALAAGTALTLSILAGGLLLSGSAFAEETNACIESCKKEFTSCTDQQITKELCTHELKVCEKECDKK
jgi:hypothetical protein